MGEGLKTDKARDAAFLLTWAGTSVGKATYLTTDSMTIQEGKRAIAQAVSDNRVKARGPGHPCANPLAQQPFWFNTYRASPLKDMSGDCSSDCPQMPHHSSRGWECNRRRRDQRSQPLGFSYLPQTVVLRVIEVHCQQHLQCHPGQTVWMDQGIPDEVDDIEKKRAWK